MGEDEPDLRASDRDREEALQLLAGAAGDGRLTLEEYSERADGALAARTRAELDRLVGDCHIELQDAVLTSPVTTIEARTTLGSVTIVVPEGVEVRLSGSVILGSHSSEVTGDVLPGAPVIDVRARAVLGSVTIKRPGLSQRVRGAVERRLPPGSAT